MHMVQLQLMTFASPFSNGGCVNWKRNLLQWHPPLYSFNVLYQENLDLLRLIAQVSARRDRYPRHLHEMQTIVWDPALGFLAQNSQFWIIVSELFKQAAGFRPFAETAARGYLSWPETLTLQNYVDAFTRGELAKYFVNTIVIVVPALLVTLFLAAMAAFVLSRYSFRGNLLMLLLFRSMHLHRTTDAARAFPYSRPTAIRSSTRPISSS